MRLHLVALASASALALLAGCSSDAETAETSTDEDLPTIVVTTNVLGDVVENLVGDGANVEVVMPRGSDPHDFQASAQQVAAMREADVLVVNGADFEAGLTDAIEAAEADGVPTFSAIDAVDALELGEGAHAHEEDEEHAEEDEHSEDEEHGSVDPHFFTDPSRMADAAEELSTYLAEEVPALATEEATATAAAYVEELRALDADVEATLEAVPADDRIMLTNHEVFGYFADRYDFEVVGTIIPGGATGGDASAGELAELVELIEAEGVPAIFADTSSPAALADTLATEAGGDVEVVELFSESLGEDGSGGETYVDMVSTNAQRIADALG